MVASLFKTPPEQMLTNGFSTVTRVIQQLPQSRLVHFVCHGLCGEESGEKQEDKPDHHSIFG